MPESNASAGAVLIQVTCTTTQGQGDILAQAAAENHVCVCDPAAAGVCVDVPDHKGPLEPFVLKSEGSADLARSFTGPGRSGLACCWLLQWERWLTPNRRSGPDDPGPERVGPILCHGLGRVDHDGEGTGKLALLLA